MRHRKRILIPLAAVCAFALVLSAAAAGLYDYTDEELEGPVQPIEFSHEIHAGSAEDGDLGIPCLYCHSAAEVSQHATIPAVSTCMGCHVHVAEGRTEGSAAEIAKLRDYYAKGESIPWIRIHNLPEYVQFKHFRHINAGVANPPSCSNTSTAPSPCSAIPASMRPKRAVGDNGRPGSPMQVVPQQRVRPESSSTCPAPTTSSTDGPTPPAPAHHKDPSKA